MSTGKQELFHPDGRSRGFYSERNRLNDLTGKEWLYWTRSVISRPYPIDHQHHIRRAHGGQKPPELCADLVRVFSKAGESVLDPFMGVGGVLIGAELAGRNATGIDINPHWISLYRQVCSLEGLGGLETLAGDAREALPKLRGRRFQLILTDVPYWQMETAPRSKGEFKRVGQPAAPRRPTRLHGHSDIRYPSKQAWLDAMGRIFTQATVLLDRNRYLVTFIGDMYLQGRYHCLSAELGETLSAIPGLVWKANLVWYDVAKALHLYGYQYAYIPSMVHQNILVLRKER